MDNKELLIKFEDSVKKTDREHTFGNYKEYEYLFQEVLLKMGDAQQKENFLSKIVGISLQIIIVLICLGIIIYLINWIIRMV